jgi:hypothetical protein
MTPEIFGKAIKELANDLYKKGEEEDLAEGGMGMLGLEEFQASIVVALQSLFPDTQSCRFLGAPLNPNGERVDLFGGEAHAEERFAARIDGHYYGASGLVSPSQITQEMIDFFMVGQGTADGDPLPPGWTLDLQCEPMGKDVDYYSDITNEFIQRFPQAMALYQSAQLQDIVDPARSTRQSPRF